MPHMMFYVGKFLTFWNFKINKIQIWFKQKVAVLNCLATISTNISSPIIGFIMIQFMITAHHDVIYDHSRRLVPSEDGHGQSPTDL